MTVKKDYQALRVKAGISRERAAAFISKQTGLKINEGKVWRFELGNKTRGDGHHQALVNFYKGLESGQEPWHVKKKEVVVKGLKANMPLDPKSSQVHIKNGEFYSTPVDGEGVSFFPEGDYLLRIEPAGGFKIYPLAIDNNPMNSKLESMEAELQKYKHGYESWVALKDLVRD